MNEAKPRYSNTKLKTFLHCRWRYKFTYVDGLVPKTKSRALQVGDVVHRILHLSVRGRLEPKYIRDLDKLVEALYPDNPPDLSLSIASEAANLVVGYLREYPLDSLTWIPGETTLELDLGDFILMGIVDAWARTDDQRLWRVERKTTAKMDSLYLQGLKGGLQGSIYDHLSEELLDEQISGTIYDILVKTKIPTYKRSFTRINRRAIERMLETVHGVHRSVMREDFYPSSDCITYQRECPYKPLCEYDSPAVREAHFIRREGREEVDLDEVFGE
jgi:hypothetical protein